MGFAVVGPGHFLASGHSDLRENLPGLLGLIESKDGAKTWTPLALRGKADFHAIEPAGNRIYAYHSVGGALLTSTNRRDWTVMEQRHLLDLAADPTDPGMLFATTSKGELFRSTSGSALAPAAGAPPSGSLDRQPNGPLVGVGADGTMMASDDRGATWVKKGSVDGGVATLDVTADRWHVATPQGALASTDEGQTWRVVLPVSSPS